MSKILKSVSSKLKKASKAHASQANKIDKVLKTAPFKMKRGANPKFKILGSSSGPRRVEKKVKDKPSISFGYEDPMKIQKIQREGLTPHSQKFSKIAKQNVKSKDYEKYSDLEKYDDDKPSPAKGKISPSCKAYAKRKFKVWPSAYASGFAVKSQKAGKC
tara:strand:- start:1227 stop:1706 length:480 start_codon:yes stop_codon:yes gene_type:complete